MRRSLMTVLGWASVMLGSGANAMTGEVRPEHPRIFITKEMIPDLKKRCETTHKAIFDRMKAACGKQDKSVGPVDYALCYLITGDRKHADFAKEMIRSAKQEFRPGQESIALDWIYDTLTKDEVKEIGAKLLKGLWDSDHKHTRCSFRDLVWWNQHYAYTFSETFMKDLFLYGEGVDDERVKKSLDDKVMCLKDCFIWSHNITGGNPEGFGYWNGMVEPQCDWATEAWRTATGEDLFKDSLFQRERGAWYLYARYPTGGCVGINDSGGIGPGSPKDAVTHLLGSRAGDRVSQWMSKEFVADPKSHYGWGRNYWCAILWHDPGAPVTAPAELPTSRIFDGLGWISMRSSWKSDATFCYFMAGDWFNAHRHQDCGSFIISSRGGYLAIDSGYYSTYQDDKHGHGTKYTTKAVAHNVMFIHDPHERSGGMWDKAVLVRDNGGALNPGNRGRKESENPTKGGPWDSADITAYEASPLFTYTAADLTGNYRRELDPFQNPKGPAIIHRYTRQLVYLAPDVFVVHDRVATKDAKYTKRFMLHVTDEPEVRGKKLRQVSLGVEEFDASGDAVVTDGGGRMFVRALLPEKAVIRRMGGVKVKSLAAGAANKGDGKVEDLKVLFGACAETITLKCVEGGAAAKFDVASGVFGKIGSAEAGKPFTDAPRHPENNRIKLDPHLALTIKPGAKSFEPGDEFTVELESHRFEVQGESPEPSYKWWTCLSHAEGRPASRRMGGWGRIEIEPEACSVEDRFLTVLWCTDAGVREMPGKCELIRETGVAATDGVRLTQNDRSYEIRFAAAGAAGGTLKVTEKGNVLVQRAFANSVRKEFQTAP